MDARLIYDERTSKLTADVPLGGATVDPILTERGTATLTNKTVKQPVTELTTDGAITIASGIVTLNKAGVLAATLAAPTAAQQGTRITIVSLTDQLHTVTFPTNTLNDGTTGINELATFAAFAGASMTVIALGVLWYVESLNAVTVTSTV